MTLATAQATRRTHSRFFPFLGQEQLQTMQQRASSEHSLIATNWRIEMMSALL